MMCKETCVGLCFCPSKVATSQHAVAVESAGGMHPTAGFTVEMILLQHEAEAVSETVQRHSPKSWLNLFVTNLDGASSESSSTYTIS
ncbi:hypothetical protein V6N11_020218 [Hibiscus sabdariffa]|uniref:Uncharacterized protein n=1 Tax=Hibiscus sabdariffa TaxID=183260 RepID=A0ABR2Q7S1_9ROSI